MKNLLAFLFGWLIAAAILIPQAHAYVATPSISGLSGSMYKPLTIPTLAGPNFSATGTVMVNGRAVLIPGYLPPAGTAAQAARSSLWANPWLVGAALLTWADDAGLGSDQVGGGWMYTDPNGASGPSVQAIFPTDETVQGCRCSTGACFCDESMQACAVNYAPLGVSERYCYAFRDQQKLGVYAGYAQDYYGTPISGAVPVGETPYGSCPSGYAMTPGTTSCAPAAETRPATQADFDSLPAPPPAALAELAPQVGVPVGSPVYQPADVAIGEPYTRPDGSTAQPMAKISPQSDGQVAIDTYDLPLTSPAGDPVVDPQPEDTPDPTQSECEKSPNTIGCAEFGSAAPEAVLTHEIPVSTTVTPIGDAGSCLADVTTSHFGITWSYQPVCDFADAIRPLIIGFAWLAFAYIVAGTVRT